MHAELNVYLGYFVIGHIIFLCQPPVSSLSAPCQLLVSRLSVLCQHQASSSEQRLLLYPWVIGCSPPPLCSMMNNEAAPSFFNGGTKQQYEDYRYARLNAATRASHTVSPPQTATVQPCAHLC